MNTASPTTVDIKKTLLHYIKAEFKEKDLAMLKSLLGSIYTELTNSTDTLPHLENPDFSPAPLHCSDRIASDAITNSPSFSPDVLKLYQDFLIANERSKNTISKYISDVAGFITFLSGAEISKEQCVDYKKYLLGQNYAVSTVNSKLCSIHSFLTFLDRADCFVQ